LLNIGLIGIGKFGLIIKSRIKKVGTLIWQANSDSDYTQLEEPDWVFIATPNVLHYEQAKFFLEKGINVFLEKPAVLNSSALAELIQISKNNNALLYISDIFLYREDIAKNISHKEINQFKWYKSKTSDTTCIFDRLTYHHLYLIHRSIELDDPSFSIVDVKKKNDYEVFLTINVNDCLFNLKYKVQEAIESEHLIFGKEVNNNPSDIDACMLMIDSIINKKFDIHSNHKSALWTIKIIEKLKKKCFPKINIIGAGIFGCTAAIEMASRGYNVDLYDKMDEILGETSSINQYRVHRGYHYPRSIETSTQCSKSASEFTKSFRQSILSEKIEHYYAIAENNSLTTAQEYIKFLDKIDLDYEVTEKIPNTSLTIKVIEDLYDPFALKTIFKNRLFGAGVNMKLNHKVLPSDLDQEIFTIAATYSSLNDWLPSPEMTQFELCEKPVLKLPSLYTNKSIVIMDGPFMCIDPLGDTGYHVMGNVIHAIHSTNIGFKPLIPDGFEKLLNKGIVKNPNITNIDLFIESAKIFFPEIEKSEYIGSMYTYRAVKPNREYDDARPTLVNLVHPKLVTIFSGKTCTSITASKKVGDLIQKFDKE